MISLINNFAIKIMPFIGGPFWARLIIKSLSNQIISEKIDEAMEIARKEIINWYLVYRWNIFVTIVLNLLIVGITLITHYFFEITDFTKFIVSCICIFMIVRALMNFIKFLVQTIFPNWSSIIHYIHVFLMDLFEGYSLSGSIRDTIHVAFITTYYENTNNFTRGLHEMFSKFGFVKSENEISEELQNEVFELITSYALRVIIYKVIAFTVYVLVYSFLLRPFIFSYTQKQNVLQVVFYPFIVAVPKVINFFRSSF